MEANTPEKLYISDSELNDAEHCVIWFKSQQNENDIEYIRTDAFIEKAADYIKKDMLDNLAFQGRLHRIEIIDGIIEKFIKAMKRE